MKISIINKGRILDEDMNAIYGGKKNECQSGFIGTTCLTVKVTCNDYFRLCKGVDGKTICGGYPNDNHGSFSGPFECSSATDNHFAFSCTTYKQ